MYHTELALWQKSIDLVEKIYVITREFPKSEQYGLTSQMRRCSISISSNIAEGAGRNSSKDFIRFLNISSGSLSELETQLVIADRLNFINAEDILCKEIYPIRGMITNLKKSIAAKLNQ